MCNTIYYEKFLKNYWERLWSHVALKWFTDSRMNFIWFQYFQILPSNIHLFSGRVSGSTGRLDWGSGLKMLGQMINDDASWDGPICYWSLTYCYFLTFNQDFRYSRLIMKSIKRIKKLIPFAMTTRFRVCISIRGPFVSIMLSLDGVGILKCHMLQRIALFAKGISRIIKTSQKVSSR